MPDSGYATATPTDILLDTGILRVGSTVVGVSRGGLTFNANIEIRNVPYDGQKAPTKGLDRITRRAPTISGTMLQANEADFLRYEAGGATPNITPKGQGLLFAAGDYLTSVNVLFNRGGGGTVVITFPSSICTQYEVAGQVDGEVEVACTFEARLVHGATPDDSAVPYTIVVT